MRRELPFPSFLQTAAMYHLTHSQSVVPRYLTLDAWVRPGARFDPVRAPDGHRGDGEIASLEVGEGTEPGNPLVGSRHRKSRKKVFTTETIPLGNRAGRILKFRFAFLFCRRGITHSPIRKWEFSSTRSSSAGADEVVPGALHDVPLRTTSRIHPESLDGYQLAVRPVRSGGFWPWGPGLDVTAVVGPPPSPEVTGVVPGPNGKLRVDFTPAGCLVGPARAFNGLPRWRGHICSGRGHAAHQPPGTIASSMCRTEPPGSCGSRLHDGHSRGLAGCRWNPGRALAVGRRNLRGRNSPHGCG